MLKKSSEVIFGKDSAICISVIIYPGALSVVKQEGKATVLQFFLVMLTISQPEWADYDHSLALPHLKTFSVLRSCLSISDELYLLIQ